MSKASCVFCDPKIETIASYRHWSILLSFDQRYLGRCIVKLNRHAVDLTELHGDEAIELWQVIELLHRALDRLFSPDKFNYAALGNAVEHLHIHVIPRYSRLLEYEGVLFHDERWGKNFDSDDQSFTIPLSVRERIAASIKQQLATFAEEHVKN